VDRRKLAQIHIFKKELNLSDAQYRNLMQRTVHVRSAKDLNDRQYYLFVSYLKRFICNHMRNSLLSEKQKKYIMSLVQKLQWTDEHLENFLRKYYHKTSLEQLTKREASKVIESLKNIYYHCR